MCSNKKKARALLNSFAHSKTLFRPVAYYYATEPSFMNYLTTAREKVSSILGKLYGVFEIIWITK